MRPAENTYRSCPQCLVACFFLIGSLSADASPQDRSEQTVPQSDATSSVPSNDDSPDKASAEDLVIKEKCPAAALEDQRLQAGMRHAPDVKTVSRPALQKLLLTMADRDQQAREFMMAGANTDVANLKETDPRIVQLFATDASNLRQLEHVITQDGFPTIAMVGRNGLHATWLLIQHADSDPQFQSRMLTAMASSVRRGEMDSNDYALLTDRVLVAQGKPQRYGSQFELRDGDWKPKSIADPSHIDQRRRSVGLGSFANNSCRIHAIYSDPGNATK
jgi:hypothetical protein